MVPFISDELKGFISSQQQLRKPLTRTRCSITLRPCYFSCRILSPYILPPSCVSFNKLWNKTKLGKKHSIWFNSSCGYMTDDKIWEERDLEEQVVSYQQKQKEGPLLQAGTPLLVLLSPNTRPHSQRTNFQRFKVK